MKILHLADTHLGFSAYRKVTEDGINLREQDTYDAFKHIIDYALESKPDLILHAGDLFDAVRPTNRAITFALEQILRVSKQGIPFVVIAGNHEHPKLKETGHIFSIFDHIEHVYPVYHARYEPIPLTIQNQKMVIHAVPQCLTKQEYTTHIKKIKPIASADYNIFLTHGSVAGIKELSMNEFNELIVPASTLKSEFDYIALGHYHKYTQVVENAFYPGSPERFTFVDAAEDKGFIERDFSGKTHLRFIPVQTRPMVDALPIDCSTLSLTQIMKKIKDTITTIKPDGKIFRIRLVNIPIHLSRGIDYRLIKETSSGAVHYEIKTEVVKDETSRPEGTSKIDALVKEYERFITSQTVDEKETLLTMGISYLEKIEGNEEDT